MEVWENLPIEQKCEKWHKKMMDELIIMEDKLEKFKASNPEFTVQYEERKSFIDICLNTLWNYEGLRMEYKKLKK